MAEAEYASALNDVKGAVHGLKEAVDGYRTDSVDRQTVENIVIDLLQKQEHLAAAAPRRSVAPSDAGAAAAIATRVDERAQELRSLSGTKKLNRILELPAEATARVLNRSQADVEAFQEVSDTMLLAAAIMDRPAESLNYFSDVYQPAISAAVNTYNAGEGADYVPTMLSSHLIERVNLQLLVAQLFEQVDMPSNPYEIPGVAVVRKPIPRAFEQPDDTGQTSIRKIQLDTRKIVLDAKKLAAMALVSKEAEEDQVIQTLQYMQQELIDYIAGSFEDALVNGDTDSLMDSDVTDLDDARVLYDGLRKSAPSAAKSDGGNAALDVAKLRQSKGLMGKYGARPDRLAHIVSMINAVQLLSDPAVFTLEKYGPQATILTGEIARVDNVPIVVSEYSRIDLNAAGVYDGSGTHNRSAALTVYRPGFLIGTRRGVTVEILRELYSEYDQDAVKITTRKAFEPRYPVDTEPVVAEVYNLKTS